MNRLVIFLNELSCRVENAIPAETMLACALLTLATLRAARQVRRDLSLATPLPFTTILLNDGTQSLRSILVGHAYKEEWRFIGGLSQSNPWDAYPGTRRPEDLEGVSYHGKDAVGMTWARANGSVVFSFGHPPDWNQGMIPAQFDEMNAAASEVSSIPIEIRNLSAPAHVEQHRAILTNYGRTISASSLVFEGGGFFIRMYAYDHNPPHFHVLLRRDTSESQAECAIQTLDILSGHLPPTFQRPVREWATTHRNDLMLNWERCQAGDRPHRI